MSVLGDWVLDPCGVNLKIEHIEPYLPNPQLDFFNLLESE